jgi:hypothetical protein
MGLYSIYQSQVAPGCLQRTNGKILETVYGGEKDVEMDRARQGVIASLPGAGPADATPFIGAERQLPRAVGESDADYAERVRTVWDGAQGWSFGGSDQGILFALNRAGFPMGDPAGVHVMKRYLEYSWLAAGVVTFGTHATPWIWDGTDPNVFTQFGIVIGADFTPPIGTTFQDGDPSAELLNTLVAKWKPAKWRFMGTIVVIADLVYDWPPGVHKWDDGGLTYDSGSSRFVKPI